MMRKLLLLLGLMAGPLASAAGNDFPAALNKHLETRTVIPGTWKGRKLEAKVSVKLDQQGKITAMVLSKTSTIKEFDEVALKLANQAQPYPPPPETLVGQPIELTFKTD